MLSFDILVLDWEMTYIIPTIFVGRTDTPSIPTTVVGTVYFYKSCDNKAISVKLNLSGTGTGTELGNSIWTSCLPFKYYISQFGRISVWAENADAGWEGGGVKKLWKHADFIFEQSLIFWFS